MKWGGGGEMVRRARLLPPEEMPENTQACRSRQRRRGRRGVCLLPLLLLIKRDRAIGRRGSLTCRAKDKYERQVCRASGHMLVLILDFSPRLNVFGEINLLQGWGIFFFFSFSPPSKVKRKLCPGLNACFCCCCCCHC